jgi:hypothetical protein
MYYELHIAYCLSHPSNKLCLFFLAVQIKNRGLKHAGINATTELHFQPYILFLCVCVLLRFEPRALHLLGRLYHFSHFASLILFNMNCSYFIKRCQKCRNFQKYDQRRKLAFYPNKKSY